jgi:para-aminobenzoate synthetase component I
VPASETDPSERGAIDLGAARAHQAGLGIGGVQAVAQAFIEVDHGPGGAPARFAAPSAVIVAREAGAVAGALAALDRALAGGAWVAGYASYELGYAFEPRLAALMPAGRRLPLLEFGVFQAGPSAVPAGRPGGALGRFEPAWDAAAYRDAFVRVAEYIRAGDIYQANLTFAMAGRWEGSPEAIAAGLAAGQPVGHGALVRLPEAVLVSRSPELFFALDGAGGIDTRPMKGTAPRDADPVRDAALRAALARDVKNRAENLMIVDLLRNDLSRIAAVGSVRVPELFAVESYATVHQMVSRVTGRMLPGVTLAGVFAALFPCGSVTGAPKIRAMEIIREIEPAPRGAYCGAIGWAAPDGRAAFNVAIRTLALYPGGEAVLNVGGGVVADSTADAEYEEALWKARFAAPRPAT